VARDGDGPATRTTTSGTTRTRPVRAGLSRDRVLRAAIELADRDGLAALSMRRLGSELGVEAMSLYNHIGSKDDLLDGMVQTIIEDLNAKVGPGGGRDAESDWVTSLRTRILTARQAMLAHKWAPALIESRSTFSAPLVAYFEGVLATLRAGGFSYDLAHHTLHALGSKAVGFSQELFSPGGAAGSQPGIDIEAMAAQFPHLSEMLADVVHGGPETTIGWCDDQTEFEFGLDVLLDGLERRRTGATRPASR
jgi:AcrR family transcriptional regulator